MYKNGIKKLQDKSNEQIGDISSYYNKKNKIVYEKYKNLNTKLNNKGIYFYDETLKGIPILNENANRNEKINFINKTLEFIKIRPLSDVGKDLYFLVMMNDFLINDNIKVLNDKYTSHILSELFCGWWVRLIISMADFLIRPEVKWLIKYKKVIVDIHQNNKIHELRNAIVHNFLWKTQFVQKIDTTGEIISTMDFFYLKKLFLDCWVIISGGKISESVIDEIIKQLKNEINMRFVTPLSEEEI